MKQLNLLKTLFLLCALMVGSSSAWADTAGFSLTAMPGTQTQKTGTITGTQSESWSWTVATSNTMYSNTSSENWQIGSKTNPITSLTLSTSGISGTITSIVVKCASYNGIGTVSAKVGTTDFQTSGSETAPAVPSWSNSACSDVTFTGSASGDIEIVMTNGTGGRAMYLKSVTVTYSTDARTPIATIGDLTPVKIAKDASGSFSVGITAADTYTVSYESSNNDVLLIVADEYLAGSSKGNVTVTVTVTPDDAVTYKPVSKEFAVSVYDPNEGDGSLERPYSVAEARAAIDAGTGVTGVYATGIVSGIVTVYNPSYSNISFNISADGLTTSDQLEAYRCVGTVDADASEVSVGDEVVVYGNLTKYNSTYEFASGCELKSLVQSVVPNINASDKTIEFDATSGEIAYTIDNPTGASLTAAITTGDWISNVQVDAVNSKVTFTATVNTGAQRTATITLSYTGANDKVVTITQKPNIYATLPFAFDGGKEDMASVTGLTHDGLGTDYASSPKLKFDGTGDNLVLAFNEVGSNLSFDIKGNGFSDGTFTVQTSADGENYSDLKSYTELSDKQSESFYLNGNVRFVKWIYTEKVSGNVALGNIKLSNSVPATITTAEYASFVGPCALDFSTTGITVYTATAGATSVTLNEIASGKVPANTPVVLHKAGADGTAIDVPVTASAEAVGSNDLKVSNGGEPTNAYVLANKTHGVGFYKWAGGSLTSGKVYLDASTSAHELEFIGFDAEEGDVTGISEIETMRNGENEKFFNLAGQRVAQPTKGLYIVNGKKVIIK